MTKKHGKLWWMLLVSLLLMGLSGCEGKDKDYTTLNEKTFTEITRILRLKKLAPKKPNPKLKSRFVLSGGDVHEVLLKKCQGWKERVNCYFWLSVLSFGLLLGLLLVFSAWVFWQAKQSLQAAQQKILVTPSGGSLSIPFDWKSSTLVLLLYSAGLTSVSFLGSSVLTFSQAKTAIEAANLKWLASVQGHRMTFEMGDPKNAQADARTFYNGFFSETKTYIEACQSTYSAALNQQVTLLVGLKDKLKSVEDMQKLLNLKLEQQARPRNQPCPTCRNPRQTIPRGRTTPRKPPSRR